MSIESKKRLIKDIDDKNEKKKGSKKNLNEEHLIFSIGCRERERERERERLWRKKYIRTHTYTHTHT